MGGGGGEAAERREDAARLALLRALQARGYRFVTPTPETHARVLARPAPRAVRDLRDVFGWSRPFDPARLDPQIVALMGEGGVLEAGRGGARSTVRVSSLDQLLFMHSAYPTLSEDAVFFGPDSYRFAAFIRQQLPGGVGDTAGEGGALVDIGAGAGVGALVAAERRPAARLVLTDINAQALRFARINAAHAGAQVETVRTSGIDGVDGPIEIALANPPYIIDPSGRAYRDGGGLHGGQLSLDLARAAVRRLGPGGRLLLYTGAAIVDGANPLGDALQALAGEQDCDLGLRELDPDVFGEELSNPQYAEVERIAVIGAVMMKRKRS